MIPRLWHEKVNSEPRLLRISAPGHILRLSPLRTPSIAMSMTIRVPYPIHLATQSQTKSRPKNSERWWIVDWSTREWRTADAFKPLRCLIYRDDVRPDLWPHHTAVAAAPTALRKRIGGECRGGGGGGGGGWETRDQSGGGGLTGDVKSVALGMRVGR